MKYLSLFKNKMKEVTSEKPPVTEFRSEPISLPYKGEGVFYKRKGGGVARGAADSTTPRPFFPSARALSWALPERKSERSLG